MLSMPAIYEQMVATAASVPEGPGHGPLEAAAAAPAPQPPPPDHSGVPAAICAAADAIPIATYLERHPGVHRNKPSLAYLSLPYLLPT